MDDLSDPLRPAPDVVVVDDGDAVYLGRLPDGPVLVLPGSAALVVQHALQGSTRPVPDRVASDAGVPAEVVVADVDALLTRLVADRWLTSSQASAGCR
jgi:hypothetical protein